MRRRRAVLGLIVLLAAALAARRESRRRAARTVPAAAPEALPLPPAPRFLSVDWTLAQPPAEEPQLAIRYAHAAHMQLDRVDVRETPTQVFVTVLVREQPNRGTPSALAIEADATAPLSRPLGERELIHTPTDPEDTGAPPL